MSVLIYPDSDTAGSVLATLIAASLIENPYLTLGLTYDSALDPAFNKLSNMASEGMLSFQKARIYQLCEFVPKDDRSVSIQKLLKDAFVSATDIPSDQYIIPYSDDQKWARICSDFELDIREHGGLDIILLGMRADGSLLYNMPSIGLAPVTHVEKIGEDKVVSAGIATLMQAKKIYVAAIGESCAEALSLALRDSINDQRPASLLQLHQNITIIADRKAASAL